MLFCLSLVKLVPHTFLPGISLVNSDYMQCSSTSKLRISALYLHLRMSYRLKSASTTVLPRWHIITYCSQDLLLHVRLPRVARKRLCRCNKGCKDCLLKMLRRATDKLGQGHISDSVTDDRRPGLMPPLGEKTLSSILPRPLKSSRWGMNQSCNWDRRA